MSVASSDNDAFELENPAAIELFKQIPALLADPKHKIIIPEQLPSNHPVLIAATMRILCNEIIHRQAGSDEYLSIAGPVTVLVWKQVMNCCRHNRYEFITKQCKIQKTTFIKHFIFPRALNVIENQTFTGCRNVLFKFDNNAANFADFASLEITVSDVALIQCIIHCFRFKKFAKLKHAVNPGWAKFCDLYHAPTGKDTLVKAKHHARWARRMQAYFLEYNFMVDVYNTQGVLNQRRQERIDKNAAATTATSPTSPHSARTATRGNTSAPAPAPGGAPPPDATPRVSPVQSPTAGASSEPHDPTAADATAAADGTSDADPTGTSTTAPDTADTATTSGRKRKRVKQPVTPRPKSSRRSSAPKRFSPE